MTLRSLPLDPVDRSMLGEGWASIALGVAALLAALVSRSALRAGPRDPADVFGERLLGALQALYLIMASLALLPVAFIVVVMNVPELADLGSIILFVSALVLVVLGARAALRTRALNGVWRPFEDAAIAAVAHGHISTFDEYLLTLPLEAAMRVSAAPAGELQPTAT